MKKNRIYYGILLGLSFIFIYFYGGKVPYMIFYTLLLLPVISFAFTLIVYDRFKWTQEIDKKFIFKGDKINYTIKIYNEDYFLYPYIRVQFFKEESPLWSEVTKKEFSVLPQSTASVSMEIDCRYRGTYPIGAKSIEIEDWLGLFRIPYRIAETKYVTVYPRIIDLDSLGLPSNYLSESFSNLKSRHEDYTTVSDVRKYQPEDSMKRIHWKLTAKKNEIMVKNYEATAESSAILILDLLRLPYNAEEKALVEDKVVETAISVIHYCLKNNFPVDLIYYDTEMHYVHAKNSLDFQELYNILSDIQFVGSVHPSELVRLFLSRQSYRNNVILFTNRLDYKLYDELCKLKAVGYEVILIYISAEELTGTLPDEAVNILNSLPENNIIYYKIGINDNIKSILER